MGKTGEEGDAQMGETVLVVDDEREIADLIEVYLKNEGFAVRTFYRAKDALACIAEEKIDLAVLDVMLPDGDGFALCRQIREEHTFPILLLTAKGEETDKITGFALGADDYVTKPFRPLELVARVKAQLRRYTRYNPAAARPDGLLVRGGLTVDPGTHECTLDGKPLVLTPTEFAILQILCEERGRVVSSEQLFAQIWGEAYFTKNNNTIATHIRHLREKMGDSVERPKYIKTVWGVGYKIEG